ncbi:MAG: hypothetical protein ACKOYK_06350 [Cyanobium sp.]
MALSPEERGARIRDGLRKARKEGKELGGLSAGLAEKNSKAHLDALLMALDFKEIIHQGQEKTLSELGKDLYASGCRTLKGDCPSPEMVRRIRANLLEAEELLKDGNIVHVWSPGLVIYDSIKEHNECALRWCFKVARKERGPAFAERLIAPWLHSEEAPWIRATLDSF